MVESQKVRCSGKTYTDYINCHMHNNFIMRLKKANTEDIHACCSIMHENR